MPLVPFLLACASPGGDSATADPGCVEDPEPVLHIGTGELAYQALDGDGDPIELVHGPQGGFHVVLALEAEGAEATDEWVAEMRGYLDEVQLARAVPYVAMQCNPETDTLQAWGFLLVWDAQPEELDGQRVLIEVDTEDSRGVPLSAAAEFTIEDPLVR